ncbi:MAG: IS1634 family transposase [Bacteroidota bacterium]
MYIRKTKIKNSKQGDAYYTYRIVESIREGHKVKQKTLLNLGKNFDIDPMHWPALISRIEQLLLDNSQGEQADLFDVQQALDETLEKAAQRYCALIIHKQSQPIVSTTANQLSPEEDIHHYETVDINELKALKARSIGVETIAWHAMKQLQLDQKLTQCGFNGKNTAAALGNIIGRMIAPGSERSTQQWLSSQSALGELMDHDYETTTLTRLYTVGDQLLKSQSALESFLYTQEKNLFNLSSTIILYDLTNTYFEGSCAANPKAEFGRSKEKRSDCRLVTMGVVLDAEGFPMNSRIFNGNASEPGTLQEMIEGLNKSSDQSPVIVLDAGIASQDNINWLVENSFQYIVVSREHYKENPQGSSDAVFVKNAPGNTVTVKRVDDKDNDEVLLYCHSEKREKKDAAIRSRFHQRFEEALSKLHQGLSKKGCTKRYEKILESIGRIKQKNSRVAQDYAIEVIADNEKKNATSIHFKRLDKSDEKDKLSGVYCLRSNILNWTEEQLWYTYVMLTDLEATFRSMKTELGLRPVYHQKEGRVTAHLLITLLAYHLVHTIRYQLQKKDIHLSWHSIRQLLSTQQRITISMPTRDNKMIYVRTTSKAEPMQKKLFDALGISTDPIGNVKTIIEK